MGVDITESSSKTKETSSKAVNGVAGLSITAGGCLSAQLGLTYAMEAVVARKDGAHLSTVQCCANE